MSFADDLCQHLNSSRQAVTGIVGDMSEGGTWWKFTVNEFFRMQVIAATATAMRSRPKRAALRSPLFLSLCEACGIDAKGLTRSAKKSVDHALTEITDATREVTPEEITRRAVSYKTRHPTWNLTPAALAKHWPEFGPGVTKSARLSISVEPANWREVAKRLYPCAKEWVNAHDFERMRWGEVSATIREEIVREIYRKTKEPPAPQRDPVAQSYF